MHSGQTENRQVLVPDTENHNGTGEEPATRTRSGGLELTKPKSHRAHIDGYNALDEMDDESDATSSGNEWDGRDDDEVDDNLGDDDEDEDMSDDDMEPDDDSKQSLLVSLRYQKGKESTTPGLTVDGQTTNGASPAGSTIVLDGAGQIPEERLTNDSTHEHKRGQTALEEGIPCQDLSSLPAKPQVEVYSPTMHVDPGPVG